MPVGSVDDTDDLESIYPESTYSIARSVSRSGTRTRVTISNRTQVGVGDSHRSRESSRRSYLRPDYSNDVDHDDEEEYIRQEHFRAQRHLDRYRLPFDAVSNPDLNDYYHPHGVIARSQSAYSSDLGRAHGRSRRRTPSPILIPPTIRSEPARQGRRTVVVYPQRRNLRPASLSARVPLRSILRTRLADDEPVEDPGESFVPRRARSRSPRRPVQVVEISEPSRDRQTPKVRFDTERNSSYDHNSDYTETTSPGQSIELEGPTLKPHRRVSDEANSGFASPNDVPVLIIETRASEDVTDETDADISSFDTPSAFDRSDFPSLPDLGQSESGLDVSLVGNSQSFDDAGPRWNRVPVTEVHIRSSSWLRNALDDESQEAKLTAWAEKPEKSYELMTWVHLEQSLMSFEDFVTAVRDHSHVRVTNHVRVVALLRKIQDEHEKQRQYGSDMTFACRSEYDYEDDEIDRKRVSSVVFMCLPYVSFEEYLGNQLRTLAPGSVHPARGLVQAHTRTCNDKRELAQAVTTRRGLPSDHCLHVSNIWCLILDERYIFTCSRLPLSDLCGDAVRIITPPHDIETKTVEITAGDTLRWHIPSEQVSSWPRLLALFGNRLSALDEAGVQLRQDKYLLNRENWIKTLNAPTSLHLKVSRKSHDAELRGHQASPFEQARKAFASIQKLHQSQSKESAMEDPGRPPKSTDSGNERAQSLDKLELLGVFRNGHANTSRSITELGDMMHKASISSRRKLEQDAYIACPAGRLEDIQDWHSAVKASTHKTTARVRLNVPSAPAEYMKQIAVTAVYVLGFFWPLDCKHVMVSHFYGALHKLLTSRELHPPVDAADFYPEYHDDGLDELGDVLWDETLPLITSFTNAFLGNEHDLQPILAKFVNAWLRLSTVFCLAAKGVQSDSKTNETRYMTLALFHLRIANDELREAELTVSARLAKSTIDEYEICSARGIAALLVGKLCKGVLRSCPEVVQIYEDYYRQMNYTVTRSPFARSHRDTLRNFQQELEAVLSISQSQRDVLDLFEQSNAQLISNDKNPNLPMFHEPRRQDQVVAKIKDDVEYKIDAIRALQDRATELGIWHLSQIESNKDQQESAIIIFTIVTIIFLPLSFVASVLGMNTSDIRNMEPSQWVYWVVAVPLTIFVIIVSLHFAGLLETPRALLWTWWSSSPNRGGYLSRATRQRQNSSRLDEDPYSPPTRRRTTYPPPLRRRTTTSSYA